VSKDTDKFERYAFDAQAVAAFYSSTTDARENFGAQYALIYHGEDTFREKQRLGRKKSSISFRRSFVEISCKKERGGVYRTIAKSGLEGLDVDGKVTAEKIESGIMTVYREKWYGDPTRPRRARILPLPPVIKGLKICGTPFRLGTEIELPKPFSFTEERREKYFEGDEPEIEPVGLSAASGKSVSAKCGELVVSADTRTIEILGVGTVTIANWTWQPPEIYRPARTAQWIQLIGLDLKNPGSGGGGGVGGNGTT